MSAVNVLSGTRTLLYKEVLRFWKVAFQTVAAPVLTAILYLLIFGHVLEDHVKVFGRLSYTSFLIPGLVMMSVLQNAFANSSSSLIQSKITGNLVFLLVAPLSHWAWFVAYVGASVVRGLVVGGGVMIATVWFAPLPLAPTTMPRTTDAPTYATNQAQCDSGATSRNTRLPVSLLWISDELLFANAFCSTLIITRPGIRKLV